MLGNIELRSDLSVSFKELGIAFQKIIHGYKDEFDRISKQAIDNFDFEKELEYHIHNCIRDGLERAFSDIDLSERFKVEIWSEIEKRLNVFEEK